MATLKKLMTLLSKEGLLEQRADVINIYTGGRTSSSKELTSEEIDSLCSSIEQKGTSTLDTKRKRVIASIFGVFQKMNKKVSMDYVKGVACRASKIDDFNKIPAARLDSLYNAFIHAQQDLNYSTRIVEGHYFEQTNYN